MTTPWTFAAESVGLGSPADRITLVEASAFAISAPNGNMTPGSAEGRFFRDTRFLSGLRLKVNGQVPEALAAATLVLGDRPASGRLSALAAVGAFGAALVAVFADHAARGRHALGGTFFVDGLSGVFLLAVAFVYAVVAIYSVGYLRPGGGLSCRLGARARRARPGHEAGSVRLTVSFLPFSASTTMVSTPVNEWTGPPFHSAWTMPAPRSR